MRFHDGEPVLAKDAVASINRWAARDSMGQMLKAIENELVALDDRTFRWVLKKPYPKILLALGKLGTPCCFVMPARIAAKRLLAESGYAGEPVTSMAAQDNAAHKAWGDVTADLLRRLGMKVDYAAVDWGTVVARRAQKSPPGQGGWQIFHTYWYGVDCVDPTSRPIRANGDKAFFGWPNIPQIETEVAAWYEAKTLDEEKAVTRRLNKAAFDNAIYAPLGLYLQQQAWRTNVTGITQGPLPFFWDVAKSV